MSETLMPSQAEENADTQGSLELGAERISVEAARMVGERATEAYFHGTTAQLEVGDRIHPGDQAILDEAGKLNASATTVEDEAWVYAESKETVGGPRPRVYEVVPAGDEPAKRLGPQRGEVNSPAFKVVGVVDTQPGAQGTFPEVNWAKYSPSITANHPRDPLWRPDSEAPAHQPDSPDQPALDGLEDRKQFMSESDRNIPPM